MVAATIILGDPARVIGTAKVAVAKWFGCAPTAGEAARGRGTEGEKRERGERGERLSGAELAAVALSGDVSKGVRRAGKMGEGRRVMIRSVSRVGPGGESAGARSSSRGEAMAAP
eukprot:scaffold54524_cov38-Tisochrysis_lutea.AAC.2